jgi:hypothetical protein
MNGQNFMTQLVKLFEDFNTTANNEGYLPTPKQIETFFKLRPFMLKKTRMLCKTTSECLLAQAADRSDIKTRARWNSQMADNSKSRESWLI